MKFFLFFGLVFGVTGGSQYLTDGLERTLQSVTFG